MKPDEVLHILDSWTRVVVGKYIRLTKITEALDFDDLLQEARIAIWRVWDNFDHRDGVMFTTYASHRVIGSLLDAARKMGYISRSKYKELKDTSFFITDYDFGVLVSDVNIEQEYEVFEAIKFVEEVDVAPYRGLLAARLVGIAGDELCDLFGTTKSRISQVAKKRIELLKSKYEESA